MIYGVVDQWTKELKYLVKNDCHNACQERDMMNSRYSMWLSPFMVVSGLKNIKNYCNLTTKELKKFKVWEK